MHNTQDQTSAETALYNVGRALWRSCLVGNPAPAVAERLSRMRDPRIGDLVMEITNFRGEPCVGTLEAIDADGFTVRRISGQRETWSNAEFIALPDHPNGAFND